MATQNPAGRGEPVRPAVVVALPEPERSEVVHALTEAGFDTIPMAPGDPLVEAFSPHDPTLTRVLAGQLYGVEATDPVTYSAVAALLIGVTLFAGAIPAVRATRIDATLAMRA